MIGGNYEQRFDPLQALPQVRRDVSGPTRSGHLAVVLHFCQTQKMKATLTVTRRGVVTLAAKLREALGIEADDVLIAETILL
jgi:hypothetical protein